MSLDVFVTLCISRDLSKVESSFQSRKLTFPKSKVDLSKVESWTFPKSKVLSKVESWTFPKSKVLSKVESLFSHFAENQRIKNVNES